MINIIIIAIHVFVCLFLIAVILLQAGRGQGLSWGVFGGTPQSVFGTKSASFLTRLTTICAVIFLFTCITLNIIESRRSRSLLGPTKETQIDFNKIRKVLDEAESKSETGQAEKPAKPPQASQADSKMSPSSVSKTMDTLEQKTADATS